MSKSETIRTLEQRQARIFRRFFFQDCGMMVCEFAPAVAAIAKIAAKIRTMAN